MRIQNSFAKLLAICFLGITAADPAYPDLEYGSHAEQKLDIYVPTMEPSNPPKIILVIHGGSWTAGDKLDMVHFIEPFLINFPDHYIANMNYRLGTISSPGYPKQLDDVELAIQFLLERIHPDATFGLFGESAGAHLALLYSYQRDANDGQRVKVIADTVGPADLTDPSVAGNPLYQLILLNLVGDCTFTLCPTLYNETSPVKHINANSPKTIGFYGDRDVLIPNSQMPILRNKLNELGIINNFTVYPVGHGGWPEQYFNDAMQKMKEFFNTHW